MKASRLGKAIVTSALQCLSNKGYIKRVWGEDVDSIKNGIYILSKSVPAPDEDVATISVKRPSLTCGSWKPRVFAALVGNFPLGWWNTA